MQDWEAWIHRDRTLVMGILNATVDSFYGPSRVLDQKPDQVADRALAMVDQGADCLDIGAESTRPGSSYIDADTEIRRILPVLRAVRRKVKVPISIDTRKSGTARICLEEGADIINDISALRDDPGLAEVAVRHHAPVILMHMQGTPETMQLDPRYGECHREVRDFLLQQVQACRQAGIEQLMIDPGIGFGKQPGDNLSLLQHLPDLVATGVPVVVGASRKGFVGTCLGDPAGRPRPVADRLAGSLGVAAWAAVQGAAMVRVHDVRETADVVRLLACIRTGAAHV